RPANSSGTHFLERAWPSPRKSQSKDLSHDWCDIAPTTPHARRGPIAPAQNHGLLGSHPDQPALPAPPDRTHWAAPAFWPVRPCPALPDSATSHDRRQPSGNLTPAAAGSVLARFAPESHPGPASVLRPNG